jgi:Holliday junction DNA helicase RuvA
MIGRLVGHLESQEDDHTIVLDVHGVGYELMVPLGTVGRLTPNSAGAVTLVVHTHVREDALTLFGFASDLDRRAFRTLISISSIGPKSAIGILSALPTSELALAVARKDVGALTRVPGVGKKTAERLVLELRDKLELATPLADGAAAKARPRQDTAGQLLTALTGMGYRPAEAERAVSALTDRLDQLPMADLIREALGLLTK